MVGGLYQSPGRNENGKKLGYDYTFSKFSGKKFKDYEVGTLSQYKLRISIINVY